MGILRLFLAISVFQEHTGPLFGLSLVDGKLPVQEFFFISGFYMSLILNEKYIGRNAYVAYISNRFLRLYPAYIAVVLLVIVCMFFFHVYPYDAWQQLFPRLSLPTLLFIIGTQWTMAGQDVMYFLTLNPITGALAFPNTADHLLSVHDLNFIPVGWSLSTEILFFVIAPFIVRRQWRDIASLIVISILLRVVLYSIMGTMNDPWSYRYFPFELAIFLGGALCYRYYRFLKHHRMLALHAGTIPWLCALIGIVSICIVPFAIPTLTDTQRTVVCLSALFLSIPFLFSWSGKSVVDRFIGELAYPLYLVHLLLWNLSQQWQLPLSNIEVLLVALMVSVGIVIVIERPTQRLKIIPGGSDERKKEHAVLGMTAPVL